MNSHKPFPSKVGPYFWLYLKRYSRILIFLLPSIALGTLFEKLSPYYFSKIIDVVSKNLNDKNALLDQIRYYFWIFVLVSVVYNVTRRFGMFLAQKILADIGIAAKKDALDYVLNHSVKFLTDTPSGTIGAKINALSGNMQDMFLLPIQTTILSFLIRRF